MSCDAMKEELTYEESMKNVVEWARKTVTPDDFWVDVGANYGYITFCLLMRNKVRGSLMIEPFPQGPLAKFMVPKAVLDEKKKARFWKSPDFPERASFINRMGGESEEIQVTTLDEILGNIDGPLVLKIDCEFTEPLIWKGMQKILPKVRAACIEYFPFILEKDAKLNPLEFLADIEKAGFKIEMGEHDIYLSRP